MTTLKITRNKKCRRSAPANNTDPASAGFVFKHRQARSRTAARRLDCSDVDLSHLHHRVERALGGGAVGIGDRPGQSDRRNLPGQAPFVLAPPARALFAAVL